MKKTFLFCLSLALFTTNLFADPWDNLTKEQAEATVKYLADNPYIIDYCDCCDHSGEYAAEVFLMKVISTEIIPSDWSDGDFSVKAKVQRVAQIPHIEAGLDLMGTISSEREEEYVILMNYTFGYDDKSKKAVPLYDVIDYDKYGQDGYCKGPTAFPNPFKLKGSLKNKAYCAWYKKKM